MQYKPTDGVIKYVKTAPKRYNKQNGGVIDVGAAYIIQGERWKPTLDAFALRKDLMVGAVKIVVHYFPWCQEPNKKIFFQNV